MGAVDEGVESDADDEGMRGEVVGQECERIGLAKEDEGFKRLLDPKLPTEQEVEDHYGRTFAIQELVSCVCEGEGEGDES